MGCGSSLPKNTGPVGISPQLKKLLVGGGEDAEGSPPSSIDLASEEYRNAKAVDGQLWGELIRAGYVHLYYNHDTCNKIKGRRKGTYFTINVLLLSLLLILFY